MKILRDIGLVVLMLAFSWIVVIAMAFAWLWYYLRYGWNVFKENKEL